jgi:hypothetical protein
MITLRQTLDEYLSIRRSLGYRYRHEGVRLAKFVAFLEENGKSHVTTAIAQVGTSVRTSARRAFKSHEDGPRFRSISQCTG